MSQTLINCFFNQEAFKSKMKDELQKFGLDSFFNQEAFKGKMKDEL